MFDNDDSVDNKRKLAEQEQALAGFSEQVAWLANHEKEQTVPNWHRAAAFEQGFSNEKKQQLPWWQWRGIPALSMACSAAAIVLVSVFLKPSTEFDKEAFAVLVDEQVNKRLAEQASKQVDKPVDEAVAALVDLKLREFAAEQQVILANYRADMAHNQQSNNLQLASYVLEASRQERKEDIGDFISFINAQRKDEQLEQKIKYQQLEREIGYQKINYKFSDQLKNRSNDKVNEPIGLNNSTKKELLEQS